MVLLVDNYDSFTYNLAQLIMQEGEEVRVVRNDAISVEEAEALDFDSLVLSPGPGGPESAGRSIELIRRFAGRKPILGVCLGHQAIGAAFGARIKRARRVMHGKADVIAHDGKTIFSGLPNPLRVIRYHSLAIDPSTLPRGFEVSATSPDGEIMAIRDPERRVEGVQFHPESVGAEEGARLLRNFLRGRKESPNVKSLLKRLAARESLGREEARALMDAMAEGNVTQAQIGASLAALSLKGATVDEIVGFASCLRDRAIPVPLPESLGCIDTCGTGGDSSATFNISTTASFVAVGAGARIAKHGNRSITSRSGSADLLEALGVPIDLAPGEVARAIEETGMAFLFAPAYHPAFKSIGGPRRELGFRTVFNMMGPLLNPARVGAQVLGVYTPELTETVAQVLSELGSLRAMVVHALDGVDEIGLAAPTKITELRDGWSRTYILDPADYGFELCTSADLKGGDPTENARIAEGVLGGEPGARRDATLLNAAAAIVVAGIAKDFREGLAAARASIDSGAALRALEAMREFARSRSGGGVPGAPGATARR
jgi:anthranilate synthase/phosphoribosyltransferase